MRARRVAVLLALVHSIATQSLAQVQTPTDVSQAAPPLAEAAYVVRGHQTEVRQRVYHDQIDRFYEALSAVLKQHAPDLVAKLSPPPPDVYGYQVIGKVGTDGPPPAPGTKSHVVSFSWGWSDTMIERQLTKLDELNKELAKTPRSRRGRPSYEKLATAYRTLISSRGSVDYDVQYNWMWQGQIAGNRALFDRLKSVQDHVVEREAIEEALASRDEATIRAAAVKWRLLSTGSADSVRAALTARSQSIALEKVAANGWAAERSFLRVEHPAPTEWRLTVPLYTDIADTTVVEAFRQSVETLWHVRVPRGGGIDDFQVRLEMRPLSPEQLYCASGKTTEKPEQPCAPPVKGDHIDVDAHVARFPTDGAVLTTGAAALRFVGNQAIVLGPHDNGPHGLAHEFGHVLGFPDAYFRGYKDLGADGFAVTELGDLSDIMGAPGVGPVVARHFTTLIDVKARAGLNLSLQLYQQQRYGESIDAARAALAIKPDYAEAYNNVAAAYAGLMMWDEAIRAASEAVRLKPDFQLAKNNLAWMKAEKAKTGSL